MQKNREFLNCFWDLAVDEESARLSGGTALLGFLEQSEDSNDLDYTLKRLIKGLSSSRDAARQGFATCLTELIVTDVVNVDTVIKLLEETTRVSGSVRRGEERDYMLGKLFGCLSLVRSNKRLEDSHVEYITKTLVELHGWKGWMKEIVSESLLLFIHKVSIDVVEKHLIPVLKSFICDTQVQDMAAWQLVLSSGLTQHSQRNPELKSLLQKHGIDEFHFDSSTFANVTPTLLASTSGFPKIHRVWTCVLSNIFPLDEQRNLIDQRSVALSSAQEETLLAFVHFIENSLIVPSHEKRGVAFFLATELARLSPASKLHVCLSKKIVRSIFSARTNKKHTLHVVATQALQLLEKSVGSNEDAKLSLASVLIATCGANFDALTKTAIISHLLEGLNEDNVIAYTKFLCQIIATNLQLWLQFSESHTEKQTSLSATARKNGERENEEDHEDASTQCIRAIQASLEGLLTLCRNSKLPGRFNVTMIAVSIFIRLGYLEGKDTTQLFSLTAVDATTDAKSDKKKKSKKASNKGDFEQVAVQVFGDVSQSKQLLSSIISSLQLVDQNGIDIIVPHEVKANALSKCLSLLSENVVGLNASSTTSNEQTEFVSIGQLFRKNGCSLLTVATELIFLLVSRGYQISSINTEIDSNECLASLTSVIANINEIKNISSHAMLATSSNAEQSSKQSISQSRQSKLCESFVCLLQQSIFNTLSSEHELELMDELSAIALNLLKQEKSALTKMDCDDDDDELSEGDSSQLRLFEISMDFLSVPEDQSIKGIRDAIRRVWTCVGENFTLDMDALDAVVATITDEVEDDENDKEEGDSDGDDNDDNDENNSDEDENSDSDENNEDEDDDDNVDEIVEKGQGKTLKQSANSKIEKVDKKVKKRKKSQTTEETENEDEEIVVKEDDLVNFLSENADDDGNDDLNDEELQQYLQHEGTPEQDAALVNLIELRKSTRKLGLVQAQKRQFLVRSRAIDILEALLTKNTSAHTLLSLISPFLLSLKKLHSSSIVTMLHEARTFEQRLRVLIEEKICKNKFTEKDASLVSSNNNELDSNNDVISSQELVDTIHVLFSVLNSPVQAVRYTVVACLHKIAKVTLSLVKVDSASFSESLELLTKKLSASFRDYKKHKNSRIPKKLFEEFFVRYPDFSVEALSENVMLGCGDAKGLYIQTDCCEIITSVLRRFKTLAPTSQTHLLSHFHMFFESMLKTIQFIATPWTSVEGSSLTKVAAKRMKVFFFAVKEALVLLNGNENLVQNVEQLSEPWENLKTFLEQFMAKLEKEIADSKTKKGSIISILAIVKRNIELMRESKLFLSASTSKPNKQSNNEKKRKNVTTSVNKDSDQDTTNTKTNASNNNKNKNNNSSISNISNGKEPLEAKKKSKHHHDKAS